MVICFLPSRTSPECRPHKSERLQHHSDFLFPGLQPSFTPYPAVVFFTVRPHFRQGPAIFTPGTCVAAPRIGGPETVGMAIQTLDGPNKVGYIRHAGAIGFMFSIFEAPIRKSRILSLRFHWPVCGLQLSAPAPSFQTDRVRPGFLLVIPMADLSRNVHRRRASIL